MEQNIFHSPATQGSDAQKTQVRMTQAEESTDQGIDLNEQLIKNRPSTFFLRVNSEAMSGAGIHAGDVVIVDRSLEPRNGKVIIALVGGEMLIRRLEISHGKQRLLPATPKLAPIDVDHSLFSVWGVVTYVIHSL